MVNDGSSDNTEELLCDLRSGDTTVLNLDHNRGKGFAIRAGVALAPSESTIIGFFDSDLDISPQVINVLVASMEFSPASCGAIASKSHPESEVIYPRIRRIGSKVFSLFVRLLTKVPYTDTQTGAKVFRADIARDFVDRCKLNGYSFDVELLARLCREEHNVMECPVKLEVALDSTVSPRSIGRAFWDITRVWKVLRNTEAD